jgi:TolB-like protein/DNA-binding winged helix-turn-helix (wHTH) protein
MRTDFQLGEWIVRPQRDCIERVGRTVHVKPKSMAVLERLAEAPGEVVTRSELFDAVWPGSAVTDDVLTQCVVELRRAFRDSARSPRFIETIPKVGFRLLSDVVPLVAAAPDAALEEKGDTLSALAGPGTPRFRLLLFITSTVLMGLVLFWYLSGSREMPPPAAGADERSLAVLPFVDISERQDQDWYAYGLTEELTARLAQLKGLRVTSRTAAYHFEDSNVDLDTIAGALDVDHLLEGSVRTDASRVRITAQLIDARSGAHTWSKQYDRPRDDIFEVQREIAEAVAEALSIQLGVGELGTMPGGTDSVEAYELLMLSKRYQWEETPGSVVQAIDCLKRAIEIDPEYADAWFRLAGMYLNASGVLREIPKDEWLQKSREALDHARMLEPDLPDLKFLTATTQYLDWQWAEVEKTMDRGAGLELSTDFDLLFGWTAFLQHVGRLREAIPLIERMRRLNPYSNGAARSLARAYVIAGRTEEGIAEAERAFELEGFKTRAVGTGLSIALWIGDRDLLQTWLARAEQYMPRSRELNAAMAAKLDDPNAAIGYLRAALQRGGDREWLIAEWAAWHGDQQLALDALERAPQPTQFWGEGMRDIRRTARFRDIVRQVGLEEYFREYGWNDFCHPVGADDFRCD